MIGIELLEGIGLTKGEVKTYFALLELGSSTTGEIIKKAKVSRSKVYEMLERLIDKGLVSFVIKNNIKYFQAASPQSIIRYVEKKKKELTEKESSLKKLASFLEKKQKTSKKPQHATVYEGINGIKTMYNEILTSLHKGEEYYAIAVEPEEYQNKDFSLFIENYHRRREEKGIKVKLLANSVLKKEISSTIALTKLMRVRYFTQEIPSATLIYKDSVVTFVWANTPTGIVTKSETIAKRYKKFFEEIWENAKATA